MPEVVSWRAGRVDAWCFGSDASDGGCRPGRRVVRLRDCAARRFQRGWQLGTALGVRGRVGRGARVRASGDDVSVSCGGGLTRRGRAGPAEAVEISLVFMRFNSNACVMAIHVCAMGCGGLQGAASVHKRTEQR